jgi:hypothetical protein
LRLNLEQDEAGKGDAEKMNRPLAPSREKEKGERERSFALFPFALPLILARFLTFARDGHELRSQQRMKVFPPNF